MWYWTTACAALDLDPYEVISENPKLASDMVKNLKFKEVKFEKRRSFKNIHNLNGAS